MLLNENRRGVMGQVFLGQVFLWLVFINEIPPLSGALVCRVRGRTCGGDPLFILGPGTSARHMVFPRGGEGLMADYWASPHPLSPLKLVLVRILCGK